MHVLFAVVQFYQYVLVPQQLMWLLLTSQQIWLLLLRLKPFSRGSNGNTTTSSNICKPQDTYRYFGHKYIEIIKVPVIIKVSLYNIILLKKIRKCRECARVKLTNNNHTLTVCSVQVPMSLTHWHTPTHPYKAKGLFG